MTKITVFPNLVKDAQLLYTKRVVEVLEKLPCEFSVDEAITEETRADLVFVLGGDGSIMRAARCVSARDIPILSINLGRVGYMAELKPEEIPLIAAYFEGHYTVDERMMLDVQPLNGKKRALALNDAVVTGSTVAHMVSMELQANAMHVANYHADGLILSTPTGSTAYSMAAGGSVIDPGLNCICATPICPYSFRSRPLVFRPDTVLDVYNNSKDETANVTVDGSECYPLEIGEGVRITRSATITRLIRIKPDCFFSVLNAKLSD